MYQTKIDGLRHRLSVNNSANISFKPRLGDAFAELYDAFIEVCKPPEIAELRVLAVCDPEKPRDVLLCIQPDELEANLRLMGGPGLAALWHDVAGEFRRFVFEELQDQHAGVPGYAVSHQDFEELSPAAQAVLRKQADCPPGTPILTLTLPKDYRVDMRIGGLNGRDRPYRGNGARHPQA